MTFVSFAPNFEDVMLWRALRHWAPGRYVDACAGAGLVTQALYDRGWSGLNLTDHPLGRARDVVAKPGDVAAAWLESGLDGEMHFLRAGAGQVDAAMLELLRPRILLVVGEPWDALAGYEPVWFDGETRFYLAPGQALQAYFQTPPGAADQFLPVGPGLRLAEAEAARDLFAWRASGAEGRAMVAEDRAAAAALRLDAASAEAARLGAQATQYRDALTRQQASAAQDVARAEAAAAAAIGAAQALAARTVQAAQAATSSTIEQANRMVQQAARTADGAQAAMVRVQADALSVVAAAAHSARQAAAQAAEAERRREEAMTWLAAIRGSTSWRVTAPLRRAVSGGAETGPAMAATVPVIEIVQWSPPPAGRPAMEPPAAEMSTFEVPASEMPASGMPAFVMPAFVMPAFETPVFAAPAIVQPAPVQPIAVPPLFYPPASTPHPVLPAVRPRAVHQFCAAPAADGALLQAMLVLRRVLRGLGYDSHIFVDTPDYGLIHETHTLAALPEHHEYVLMMHQTAGQPVPQAVLDVPVAKVLFHHGSAAPAYGLEELRPAVITALADTELGSLALRRLGFPGVATCTLLWEGETAEAAPEGELTILGLSRPADAEAGAWLEDVFARFRVLVPGPATLVRDVARPAHFAVFASTSGEADPWLLHTVARGVPVLARAAGAIPYLIAPGLVFDPAPAAMALAMAELAQDRTRRMRLLREQRAALPAVAVQMPALLAALAQAGAAPMPPPATLDALAAQAQFTLAGPVGGDGLGAVTRAWAVALSAGRPGAVRLVPPFDELAADGVLDRALGPLLSRPPPSSGPHVSIAMRAGAGAEPSDVALCYAAGEDDPAQIGELQASYHGVLAPSRAVAKSLIEAGLQIPVRVIGADAQQIGLFAASLLLTPGPRPERPAVWITTWDLRCGIAEYSRHLMRVMPGPAIILADTRTAPGAAGVMPVWAINEPDTLHATMRALMRQDPVVVMIQHQPGLLPWPMLTQLLEHPALSGRVVTVTLHNTQELAEADAAALGALGRMSRVVVHSQTDMETLAGLGLAANSVLIPQGADPAVPGRTPRGLTPADPVVIGSYGFFLPGKGLPELIEALALLRAGWPQARLRLVNAEYPLPVSAQEIAACRALVDQHELTDVVSFETEFLDHATSTARLQECDVLVLPYQGSREGSSAALRSALMSGVPVTVTPLVLFAEAGAAAITLPGTAPADIAAGLDRALRDQPLRQATAAAAQAWLDERSWSRTGERLQAMLDALLVSGEVVS